MTKRKLALAAPLLTLAAVAVAFGIGAGSGLARSAGHRAVFKAAWIYVGPHNGGGWS